MQHKIWKTITIGTDRDIKNHLDCSVSYYAKSLIEKMQISAIPENISLVEITLSDWFGKKYPTTKEIFTRAESEGLELCPAETALYLSKEFSEKDWVVIAHEPITASGGRPLVFRVGRGGGGRRWLGTDWVDEGYTWLLGSRLVFRLRKSLALSTSEPSDLSYLVPLKIAIESAKEALDRVDELAKTLTERLTGK